MMETFWNGNLFHPPGIRTLMWPQLEKVATSTFEILLTSSFISNLTHEYLPLSEI
jgi:hypothetical protein